MPVPGSIWYEFSKYHINLIEQDTININQTKAKMLDAQ